LFVCMWVLWKHGEKKNNIYRKTLLLQIRLNSIEYIVFFNEYRSVDKYFYSSFIYLYSNIIYAHIFVKRNNESFYMHSDLSIFILNKQTNEFHSRMSHSISFVYRHDRCHHVTTINDMLFFSGKISMSICTHIYFKTENRTNEMLILTRWTKSTTHIHIDRLISKCFVNERFDFIFLSVDVRHSRGWINRWHSVVLKT